MYQPRRRKKRHTHGLRTVEVMRGKSGYGFTISGQHPCILSSIVTNSPADCAGLKTGDFLISANGLNVSKSSHDDVVRLVGSSSGLLVLQIAENYNSSDSSDDEFQNRPKSKYPNRARRREGGHKDRALDDMYAVSRSAGNKYSGTKKDYLYEQLRARALSPGREFEQRYQKTRQKGNENINPHIIGGALPKKAKHISSNDGIIRYRSPNTKHTIITREARLGIQKSQSTPEGGFLTPVDLPPKAPLAAVDNRQSMGYHHPYVHPQIASRHHTPNLNPSPRVSEEDFEVCLYDGEDMRVVVGYAGSIEMPRDPKVPNSRLQSIRGAVRRLRVEQKIHTLVLMEVTGEGVKLINTMSCIIAQYPSERVAFCGVCPDDIRFFGVVTLHNSNREGLVAADQGTLEDGFSGSSCHVFMVDPELSVHSAHAGKARNFGFSCTVHPDAQRCLEFPRSATPIVQCVAKLYRERQTIYGQAELAQIGAFAGPNFAQRQQRNESTSSNSDSGHGYGNPFSDENDPGQATDKVCVVEMHSEHDVSGTVNSSADNSVYVTPSSSLASSMYSSRDASSILLSTGERIIPGSGDPSALSSTMDTTSSSLNSSGIPVSTTMDRLNIRAMPNPRSFNMSGSFGDLLEQQNSADNLRKSMHRMLRSRQKTSENPSGSDAESVRSESSQGTAQFVVPVMPVSASSQTNLRSVTASDLVPPPLPPRNSQGTKSNSSLHSSTGTQHGPEQKQVQKLSPRGDPVGSDEVKKPRQPVISTQDMPQAPINRERMQTPSRGTAPAKTDSVSTPGAKPPQITAQTPNGTRLSGFGAMPDGISAFSRPKGPGSASRPPLPERKPIPGRSAIRTPVRTPQQPERPKSTPPFRDAESSIHNHNEDYDSDPGDLSSYADSLMDVEEWNNQVSEVKTPAPKTAESKYRRRSEGFNLHKQPVGKDHKSLKSGAAKFFHLGKKNKLSAVSSSHESLVVSDAEFPHQQKLHGAISSAAICQPNGQTPRQNGTLPRESQVGRAAGWAVNFDKLLSDSAGRATFTEFLKKEYSEENIVFWCLCEKYKKIKSDNVRKKRATEIYNAHLAPNAPEPINVDSGCRKKAEEGLEDPSPQLFDASQLHIYKLMKQDSYARFLRSELYKECVVAEVEGRPLAHPGETDGDDWNNEDTDLLKVDKGNKPMKKSKSTTNAEENNGEEKRRRSLLPWTRVKSEKKLIKQESEQDLKKPSGIIEKPPVEDAPSTVDLPDLSLMRKEVQAANEKRQSQTNLRPPTAPRADAPRADAPRADVGTQDGVMKENQKFCRVILPDKSTTVIYAKPGQTVKDSLAKLCDRRNINMELIEIHQAGTDKPISLNADIYILGSKEIIITKYVIFRLDLPNRKSLAIKTKSGTIRDVFKPILNSYGFKLDNNLVVHVAGTGVVLNEDTGVRTLDSKHVIVQSLDEFKGKKKKEWGSFGGHRSLSGKPPIPRGRGDPSPVRQAPPGAGSLEDVLKTLFKDVSDSVTLSSFDENGVLDPEKKEKKCDENRNSGLFGFIRRNSLGEKDGKKVKNKVQAVFSSQRQPENKTDHKNPVTDSKKPLPNVNVRKPPVSRSGLDKDETKFLDLLSKASRQLDDQRGLTAKGLELPEFLKVDKSQQQGTVTASSAKGNNGAIPNPRLRKTVVSDSNLIRRVANGPVLSRTLAVSKSHEKLAHCPDLDKSIQSVQSFGTPMSQSLHYQDMSFSHDGIVPTHGEAEQYFSELQNKSSSNFDDSKLMDRSLRDIGIESGNVTQRKITFGTYRGQPMQAETPNKEYDSESSKPVPKPRQHRPNVPRRRNPPSHKSSEGSPSDNISNTPSGSSSDLEITLLPPSSDSSEAEPSPPGWPSATSYDKANMAGGSPPTPMARKSRQRGVPSKPDLPHSLRPANSVLTYAQHSTANQNGCINSLPHSTTVQPMVTESDLECEIVNSFANQKLEDAASMTSSTPSPTTHDLVLETESSPDSESTTPTPSVRTSIMKKQLTEQREGSDQKAKKTLVFDRSEASGDMQVSFV